MELTQELKAKIDAMSMEDLLRQHRFSPVGDPLYQGESGTYCIKRLTELRNAAVPGEWAATSKRVGWEHQSLKG